MSNPTYTKVQEGAALAKEIKVILERAGVVDFKPLPLGVIVTVAYPACNARFAFTDVTHTFSVPKKQMVSGGFGILSHIMETYFSICDEENVSDDISEALMRGVIRNLRTSIQNPQDYSARSNLLWESTMAENRIIKLDKKRDFQCHQMEHQLGAYTNYI